MRLNKAFLDNQIIPKYLTSLRALPRAALKIGQFIGLEHVRVCACVRVCQPYAFYVRACAFAYACTYVYKCDVYMCIYM